MAKFTYVPNRIIGPDGLGDGGAIYVYETESTTPVILYSDPELTTPVSNPYVVSSGALVPTLYYAERLIRVRVVSSKGEELLNEDPYEAFADTVLRENLISTDTDQGASLIGAPGGGTISDVITSVSPDQFGAVGDGTTDDTAAFVLATSFAGAGTLRLSKGKNYRVSSTLNITQPVTIIGYGAKLNTGSNNISALSITSSDVTVLGLEIEGAGNGSYATNGRLITIDGVDNGAGVAPTYIRNIRIRDCKLTKSSRSAIRAQFVTNLIVEGNDISDVAYCGVELLSCTDVQVPRNFIKDVTPGTSGNGYGVYFSRQNTSDLVRYPLPERGSSCYNHIENIEWEGIDCHGGNDFDFSHNTLINCGDTNAAIAIIHADNESSTPIAPATNVRVIGNIIKGSLSFGIAISNVSASVIHSNITIEANTLENCGGVSYVTERCGLRVGSAKNVSIVGNTFNYCAPYGIVINNQYASNISMYANTFRRIVSNSFSTPAAIRINRGAAGTGPIILGGNTAVRASTGETYELVRGLDVESTDGGNIRVEGNNFGAAGTKYVITLAQASDGSNAVVNYGTATVAVTTGVSTANTTITLPNSHSANTVYVPTASIFAVPTGNERIVVHCIRLSTTQIRVTVYTANGSNFPASGNITVAWQTVGL